MDEFSPYGSWDVNDKYFENWQIAEDRSVVSDNL